MKISERGKQRLHTLYMQDKNFENLHLLKVWQTPPIQTVTEHRTASTDRRCEYLNGYMNVQHRSFGKPSFLDP